MKQLVQIQKLKEVKEDIIMKIEYEDPRGIKGLGLSKHLKRKKSPEKCVGSAEPLPILKIDVLILDASGVTSWVTPKPPAI